MSPLRTPRTISFLSRLRPLALVAALFPCAATGVAAESAFAQTMPVPDSPTIRPRVATLIPYVADALHRVGLSELVVASVRSAPHIPLESSVIDLGNSHSPSIERLADARPTLVVGDRDLHAGLEQRLSLPGAQVHLVRSHTVDATFDGLIDVAARIGKRAAMEAEIVRARADLASFERRERTAVVALFGAPGTFLAITGHTWLGDLLARLGFANLAAEASGESMIPGYVQLSDEALATFDPDLVIVVAHGDPTAVRSAFRRLFEHRGLFRGAERSGHVHLVGPPLFTANPGLAIVDVARWLNDLRPAPPNGSR